MPQIFRLGSYWVYFWSNENKPLEPIHVHISKGHPSENATKIWITKSGKCYLCHNKSNIPDKTLRYDASDRSPQCGSDAEVV